MTIPFFAHDEIFRFFLLLARVSAILLTFPFLSSRSVPSHLKILFIVLLSITLYPIVRTQQVLIPTGPIHLGLLVLGESLIGMMIGFTGQLLFAGVQLGGTVMETQMGLGLANTIDPNNGQQITIVSNFQYIMGFLLFLSINGHHMLISAMAESLHVIPLMDFSIPTSVSTFVIALIGKTFVMAIRIAAPIIVTLLLTHMALGIIARMVPQINIFILSMPVNLGIGLLLLSLALPYLSWVMRQWLGHLGRDMFLLIRLLAGG